MNHKIKEINRRLSELAAEWDSFGLRECSNDNRRVFQRDTHSFVNSWDVIGREDDKRKIIDLLMRSSDPVIPIVGLGGLGKTTVAQLVYNYREVTRLFQQKLWVCVPKEFDLPSMLKLMIHSINREENCDNSGLDALQNCLRSLLKDKEFLLVLDDVWNDNQERWADFIDILSSMGGWFKSKIIVTTRSLTVASIISPIRPIELEGLPHEDCLRLFKKRAFKDGDERRHPNLMRIGDDIVKRCKGVPLAVRTLGSLLYRKTDESYWISVRDSEMWRLEQSDNSILPVLKLSYDHLPSRLQRCFAFLALYKKDEIYRSHEVIQLWMANGLLEHPRENQEWEAVGDRYLYELLSRCLIEKEKDYGTYFAFRMHDLVHDLALEVSQKECKTVSNRTTADENVRHLSFSDDKLEIVPHYLQKLRNVRTVIIQGVSKQSNTIEESLINLCVSNFEHLRVLRLRSQASLTGLHKDIGKLKHLRDLDLAGCRSITELPRSFYELRLLQKLRMSGIPLKQLPKSMKCLIELRYLEITIKAKHLTEIQQGCWPCLQHLGLIDCDNLECLPEGLKHLTSLGTLDLLGCSNLVSLPRSMKFLTRLQVLSISSCKRINLLMEPEEGDVNLQLSLKTLSLWDLEELKDLPELLLKGSSSTLRRIRIESCNNIEALPVWLKDLTSLHELEILDCPKMPTLPEEMDWTGLDWTR
ncbi:Leucine-rich repeat containing protein isoform 2 [Hibiscus syriacus]|uniref:Leucine-rich repeat containing protein isoform 2 n=2 Tax=Hibiscus syriacus TaxID=106335 RepID=A0A6A3C2Z2_HIBSY|nr:Leucine-rich repeat containing protein isoform 2 [Hibiscus syriacus]